MALMTRDTNKSLPMYGAIPEMQLRDYVEALAEAMECGMDSLFVEEVLDGAGERNNDT